MLNIAAMQQVYSGQMAVLSMVSGAIQPEKMKPLLIFIALQTSTLVIDSSEGATLTNSGCCETCYDCCGGCCCCQQFSSSDIQSTDEDDTVETRSPFIPALVAGAVELAEVAAPAIIAGAEALVEMIGPALATVGRLVVNAVKNVPPQMWDNIGTALGVAADAATVVYEKR